jgi:predicted nucleotidyltransferase
MKSLEELKKIINEHKKELEEKYKVKSIAIFGSYVRKEQNKKSNVDILVDFHEIPDLLKFIEIERYLEEILGLKVDLVRKPVLRMELRDKILSEAIKI